jgi:hypothetical protein
MCKTFLGFILINFETNNLFQFFQQMFHYKTTTFGKLKKKHFEPIHESETYYIINFKYHEILIKYG